MVDSHPPCRAVYLGALDANLAFWVFVRPFLSSAFKRFFLGFSPRLPASVQLCALDGLLPRESLILPAFFHVILLILIS